MWPGVMQTSLTAQKEHCWWDPVWSFIHFAVMEFVDMLHQPCNVLIIIMCAVPGPCGHW